MELGLYTDSVPELGFEAALDLAVQAGIPTIEIATGGQSWAPHLRLDELLADAAARERFLRAFRDRDLRIAALNCSAWPLHPVHGAAHERLIRDTFWLAEALEVESVVTMSGNPGDGGDATTIDWIFYPWPDDATALRERQWGAALELWASLALDASAHGVRRIAFELHPLHLVYNVPTLRRIREAVGPILGANLDPSHLFWQRMDPLAVIAALGDAIFHVHLKDTEVDEEQVAIAGVLDGRPFDDPTARGWRFVTVGRAHDAAWWRTFLDALAAAGFDGSLAIEHEDATQSGPDGVLEAAAFIRTVMEPG